MKKNRSQKSRASVPLTHCGVIPVQSFGSHIRPQPHGLGLNQLLYRKILELPFRQVKNVFFLAIDHIECKNLEFLTDFRNVNIPQIKIPPKKLNLKKEN